nr:hypothetical protein BaRGS_015786 [Batillaria attramentaria]
MKGRLQDRTSIYGQFVMPTMLVFFALLLTVHAQEIRFEILEEAPPGFLGNIPLKANLTSVLGQKELSDLQYTVVDDNLGVGCDVAVQSSSPESAFFRKLSVVVYILDVNDHAPEFPENNFVVEYKVQRYFLEPKLDEFDLLVVKDEDPSGELKFTVALRVVKPLDREERELYTMSLVAQDGGEVRENADGGDTAGFDRADRQRHDADRGDNARVSYDFHDSADSTVKSVFSVDVTTGDIRLRESLDMRGGNTYNFKVVAKDNGVPQLSSESRVVISVLDTRNDRPEINVKPLFSHAGAAVVRESAAIGKVAALLTVTDHDFGRNGIVSCDLDNVHFSLQKLDENEYKIIVAQPLDRERAANHTVVIYCRDGGDPALSTETILRVEVSDSNDNNPVFSSSTYYLSVDENETIGSKVGRVTATDKDFGENARLIYGMEDNGDTFTIDTMLGTSTRHGQVKATDGDYGLNAKVEYYMLKPKHNTQIPIGVNASGAVVVQGKVDFEQRSFYEFVVAAVDMGSPPQNSTARVVVTVIDSNDNEPVITFPGPKTSVNINFDSTPGSEIARVVAYDRDSGRNGQLTYSISIVNGSSLFVINRSTGVISLGKHLLPRYERSYNIMVSVRDNGIPQRAQHAALRINVKSPDDELQYDVNMKIVIAGCKTKNKSVSFEEDTMCKLTEEEEGCGGELGRQKVFRETYPTEDHFLYPLVTKESDVFEAITVFEV